MVREGSKYSMSWPSKEWISTKKLSTDLVGIPWSSSRKAWQVALSVSTIDREYARLVTSKPLSTRAVPTICVTNPGVYLRGHVVTTSQRMSQVSGTALHAGSRRIVLAVMVVPRFHMYMRDVLEQIW